MVPLQDNLADVVRLADKYALLHVMYKVQTWVLMTVRMVPATAFPHVVDADAALRALQLRETLLKCGLGDADRALEQLMLQDLMLASTAVGTWTHYTNTICTKCSKCPVAANSANICQPCHNSTQSSAVAARAAMGTALKTYSQGGICDQGAACKVLASVGHILATNSMM